MAGKYERTSVTEFAFERVSLASDSRGNPCDVTRVMITRVSGFRKKFDLDLGR